jgi:hypothetical protein
MYLRTVETLRPLMCHKLVWESFHISGLLQHPRHAWADTVLGTYMMIHVCYKIYFAVPKENGMQVSNKERQREQKTLHEDRVSPQEMKIP